VAKYRQVLASPADVAEERQIITRLIDEENRNHLNRRGVHIELSGWDENAYPALHAQGAQGHIFVAVFWTRFGSIGASGMTGSEEEIHNAIEAWRQNGRPEIMIYYKQEKYLCTKEEEALQWARVLGYKERIQKEGLCWDFFPSGEKALDIVFRGHLANVVNKLGDPLIKNIKPSSGYGAVSQMKFINKTGISLKLFHSGYREGDIRDVNYIIEPNSDPVQDTWVGHVWVLQDFSGRKAVYEAKEAYHEIVVDKLE
jgi:hypothetical protein